MTDIIQGRWEFTSNGNGETITNSSTGALQFVAFGTFGGGTVSLESSFDSGVTWIPLSASSITSNGLVGPIYASQGEKIKAVLSGATNPSIIALLQKIET